MSFVGGFYRKEEKNIFKPAYLPADRVRWQSSLLMKIPAAKREGTKWLSYHNIVPNWDWAAEEWYYGRTFGIKKVDRPVRARRII